MKKINKLLLAFILLFLVGISSVSASTTFYRWRKSNETLMLQGLITYDWYAETNGHDLCANSPSYSCKEMYSYWNLYSVVMDGKTYITYCVNPNKDIHHEASMTVTEGLGSMRFSSNSLTTDEKNARLELLKKLLLYGYNPDPTNSTTMDSLWTNDLSSYTKRIAMQVLVWEVMEGGRTTFDTVAPDAWNGDYSFYNKVIYPNGGSNPSQTGTLFYYYNLYREAARVGDQAKPATAFDEKNYVLSWDSANKQYKATITGLGDYTTCTSDNADATVTVSGQTATIISSKTVQNAKITCKYFRGTGNSNQTKEESFKYFRFVKDQSSTQDMVYGSGWKIYSNYFYVSSENTDFSIKKVDTSGRDISGAKFKLTHMTNTSYIVTLDSNTTTKYSLNYSGQYRVSESVVPAGYSGIRDFYLTIDAKTHKITKCDDSGKDNGGNIISCLNGLVGITYNNNAIALTIKNEPKNFKIIKVDKDYNLINGATFEIRDNNNNVVKFNKGDGNIFEYAENGTLTSLNGASLSSYSISLLPEGEYKVVETSVPEPYQLPSDEESKTTYIKINSKSDLLVYDKNTKKYVPSGDATIKVINYKTKVNIEKTGFGSPIEGVQFELYNADKTQKIKCILQAPGIYNYSSNQGEIDNSVYITNSLGKITINNLPAGIYYLKEIYTPNPFVLPQGDGVYTKFEISIDENGTAINGNYLLDTIFISNSPNSFNFYKRDTEGNALTTGKYKLQKYDKKTKKYVDLKLVEVKNDGTYNSNTDIYKVDEENGKIQFALTKGVATFIEMEPSTTYRIIETVAPTGYTKASTKDTATAYIDEYGNASGLLVLIDQKIVREEDSAYAELIINIQTGKQRIMYAAVIFVVIGIITALIVYNKRK